MERIGPSVPARSVRELVALAKSRPGALNYAGATMESELKKYAVLIRERGMKAERFTSSRCGVRAPGVSAVRPA